jgi:hypothetical protein
MTDPLFTKYKYMLGESTYKKKFDGCIMPDAGIEGNTVTGNRDYIAVSFIN